MIVIEENLLRMKCDDVAQDEANDLIMQLEAELANSARLGRPGFGLAAPQIGIHKKAAIIRFDKIHNIEINLVNPKIEKMFDPAPFHQEGCLSFPGKSLITTRYQEIYVTSNLVYPHDFIATGLIAVIIQHEIDHLNGILFTDRIDRSNRQTLLKAPKIKLSPNDICFCGSKLKYKRCCGRS